MKRRNFLTGALVAAALGIGSMGAVPAFASPENPVIGFSIDDLRVERWARDRDYFIAAAEKLGAKVNVQSADGNEEKQVKQVENLISQGVDAIVIVPMNSKVFDAVVADAKASGIKVLSYDRLILNADIDAYISFDNERVGFMQAEAVLKAKPEGNYYLLGGSPTDNNAKLLRAGQEKALKEAVDSGKVKIVGSQWVKEWSPTEALSIMENALTAASNKIDAVVASNDGTAGGAIQALAAQGLAGKTAVSGQDSDLAAVNRLVDGTQTVTVYKPLKLIAEEAAKLTVQLVRDEKPEFNGKIDNGSKEVDTLLLTPTAVTKDNIDVYVTDGFYTKEQIEGK
ncbi:D-xylose ABC transporter substrate-binding protein [Brucella pituitosa]|uniref:D-xylose ABC transporter substrate-binding protein n=1 Tax=Brucella pituitosa TaxID=571256 RepID=UPI0009A18D58|nr:D-xylose ABC transporter substrate-binding protein [Brucella pituitosa]